MSDSPTEQAALHAELDEWAPRQRPRRQPRKYGPGEPFANLNELLDLAGKALAEKSAVFVWRGSAETGRPEHIFWTMNTSCYQLHKLVTNGTIRRAVVRQEYRIWAMREAQS